VRPQLQYCSNYNIPLFPCSICAENRKFYIYCSCFHQRQPYYITATAKRNNACDWIIFSFQPMTTHLTNDWTYWAISGSYTNTHTNNNIIVRSKCFGADKGRCICCSIYVFFWLKYFEIRCGFSTSMCPRCLRLPVIFIKANKILQIKMATKPLQPRVTWLYYFFIFFQKRIIYKVASSDFLIIFNTTRAVFYLQRLKKKIERYRSTITTVRE